MRFQSSGLAFCQPRPVLPHILLRDEDVRGPSDLQDLTLSGPPRQFQGSMLPLPPPSSASSILAGSLRPMPQVQGSLRPGDTKPGLRTGLHPLRLIIMLAHGLIIKCLFIPIIIRMICSLDNESLPAEAGACRQLAGATEQGRHPSLQLMPETRDGLPAPGTMSPSL